MIAHRCKCIRSMTQAPVSDRHAELVNSIGTRSPLCLAVASSIRLARESALRDPRARRFAREAG